MNKAAAASLVVTGMWLAALPAAGLAAAAPTEDDATAVSADDHSPSAHTRRPATRPGTNLASVQRTSPVTAQQALTPVSNRAATRVSGTSAKASSVNPIVSFLFNQTPTVSPTQQPPGPDGVVHGALNADDADGNSLTYTVVTAPSHGQVAVDGSGNFTYTPANPQQLTATDTFAVRVSDAESGFHLHGILGLINLLTFGLIGSSGHTTTRTITLAVAPAVDTTAYILPVKPGVSVKSLLTAGDSPTGVTYPMVGAPDGLGLFDNNDGTFTVLMNHELGSGSGAVRAHGATGAFISRYIIDKATLEVVGGSDLIQKVFAWNTATQSSDVSISIVAFNRFCSGDLASASAFSYNGLGAAGRIYLTGEEGGSGRAVATVATGPNAGNSYILGTFNPATNGSGLTGTPSWENLLANPYGQDKTVVIGNNDGGSGIMAGALAVYVGTKQASGTEVDKAGLTNGGLKFVNVTGNPTEIVDATSRSTNITSGTTFTLSSVASTSFSRPEDGAWNPLKPNEYYFVTTDRLDQVSDGVGSQVGRSRLWRLTFADITNPDAGGTIDLLIDGDTADGAKVNMLDNLTVDYSGRILIQEDTGAASHNAKIWQYDIASDTLTLLAKHDPARFGDIGVSATAPFTTDEESSGIIDAQDVFGPGWYLLDVMAHYPLGGALVEGGQLLALYDAPPAA